MGNRVNNINIETTRNTEKQLDFYSKLDLYLENIDLSEVEKVRAFPVYTTRQTITTFLERYEIYKLIKNVPGSIIECGVGSGLGIFSFMHFCSIFEPYHYTRKLYGFDTFEGFQGITDKDLSSNASHLKKGGLNFGGFERFNEAIKIHDLNRALGHLPKMEMIKGDISLTMPEFINNHPELVIGLLYLDLDLYKPTFDTIKSLIKKVPKGGIICFDEINHQDYPGETSAVIETLGINNINLKRLDFSSMMSYSVVGQ